MSGAYTGGFYTQGGGTLPPGSFLPILSTSSPTTNNKANPGQLWIDSTAQSAYIFTGASSAGGTITYTWVLLGSTSGSVTTLTGNSGGAISPSSGNINLLGSGSVNVTGSGSTLTVSFSGTSLSWSVNNVGGAATTNNGYIVTSGSPSFSLPSTSSVGDQLAFMLDGGTQWTITQAAGQQIRVNGSSTTAGITGSVVTNASGQTIFLICTTANTTWQALSFVGNLTVN